LWLNASLTKTPKRIPEGPLKGSLFDVFDKIHISLAKQSRRNAQAAAMRGGRRAPSDRPNMGADLSFGLKAKGK
jgi:hypothetical protein